jgi:cysteine desulfurase
MTATRTYLDHAATTPLLPAARDALLAGLAEWANPSSPHAEGRRARAALEDARARIAAALGWHGEVILTSGASEALAIAMGRARADRRLVSAVEHDAVFRAAPGAGVLPMAGGTVDRDGLAAALEEGGSAVVAVQTVNPETGTVVLAPGDPLAEQVRDAGGILVADCSQSAGKAELPDADMIVVSAHKLGGPIGCGALLVRDYGLLAPSGGQERGYRGGTENLPGALAFAAAVEVCSPSGWNTSESDRARFRDLLAASGEVLAPGVQSSHIHAAAAPRISANALLVRLDAMGFAVSAGSACSSGTLKPGRALAGFGIDPDVAGRTIRVSIGWSTTPAELDRFAEAWRRLAEASA